MKCADCGYETYDNMILYKDKYFCCPTCVQSFKWKEYFDENSIANFFPAVFTE